MVILFARNTQESADPRNLASPHKLLFADIGTPLDALEKATRGHEVVVAKSLAEALTALARARFDLIVASMCFEDTRVFDLLRYARSSGVHKPTPFVCFWHSSTAGTAVKEALEIALSTLGATALIEIEKFGRADNLELALKNEIELYLPPRHT